MCSLFSLLVGHEPEPGCELIHPALTRGLHTERAQGGGCPQGWGMGVTQAAAASGREHSGMGGRARLSAYVFCLTHPVL